MTKRIVFGFLVYIALYAVSAACTMTFGQRPDPSGKGRYVIETNNSIFTQPAYTGPASLNGLGLKSAKELGVAGKKAWNEYPGGPKLITLSEIAMIYHDTGSMELYYLDGCLVNGKRRPNRIKLAEEIVTVEKEKIVEVEKIVEKPVEKIVYQDKIVEKLIEKECIDCSVFNITGAEFVSKGFGARMPSWKELLIAGAEGAGSSAIFSNEDRGRAAIWGGVASVGKTTLYNVFTPDKNALILTVNGQNYLVQKKKGQITINANGVALLVEWSGNQIYGRLSTTGAICFTAYVQNAFTVGSVTVVYRRGSKTVTQTVPVKSQPPTSIPTHPSQNAGSGQPLPGGGNPVPTTPGTTVPTRPTRAVTIGGVTKLVPVGN